jgi:cobalamin biosynthesis Mg chelatase CobN
MNGMRHRLAPRAGRPIFGLVSVLALLALACFPVLAQADSSEAQYEDAPDTATGGKISTRTDPPAGASSNDGGNRASNGSTTPNASDGGSSEDEASTDTGGAAGKGGGDKGQGSRDDAAVGKKTSPAPSVGNSLQGSDDSSPLVPILIAIVVLAAISVGMVVMRQRRQSDGPDAHVSPEAG